MLRPGEQRVASELRHDPASAPVPARGRTFGNPHRAHGLRPCTRRGSGASDRAARVPHGTATAGAFSRCRFTQSIHSRVRSRLLTGSDELWVRPGKKMNSVSTPLSFIAW